MPLIQNKMVYAYYMQDPAENQCEPCKLSPSKDATIEDLLKVGVWTTKIPIENGWEATLKETATQNNLNHRDEVTINRDKLDNYDSKIKMFFEEHLHNDPEVRFVKEGSGYFDVRDAKDQWIRIAVEKGDLVFLPAGIYHRFTVDTNDYIQAIRLFKDEPKWEAVNRSDNADDLPTRKQFLKDIRC